MNIWWMNGKKKKKEEEDVVIIPQDAYARKEENKWHQTGRIISMQGDKRNMHKVLWKQEENVIICVRRNRRLLGSQSRTWNTQWWVLWGMLFAYVLSRSWWLRKAISRTCLFEAESCERKPKWQVQAGRNKTHYVQQAAATWPTPISQSKKSLFIHKNK